MTAPPEISGLIETFSNNIDFYKSDKYNEAQLRQEFIDPLFKHLGWDMDNAMGFAPQYRDVIHEASIKIAEEPLLKFISNDSKHKKCGVILT